MESNLTFLGPKHIFADMLLSFKADITADKRSQLDGCIYTDMYFNL